MGKNRTRLVALSLALEVIALAGCGRAAPGTLDVARPAARAPVASARQAPPAPRLQPPVRERVEGPDPVEPPPAPSAELFKADYSETDFKRADPAREDAETAREVRAQLSVGGSGASWGSVGGGIGAGLLGASFLGYFVYAGMVGSRDLMFPEKTTYRKDPSAYGIPYEAVTFHAHDGLRLAGWYVPAAVPTNKGLVLFHGHSSNKDTVFRKYGQWLHARYNLFVYDSRYHGESEGKFTTLGYFERKDALIAIDQLRARGTTSVGVMGESMGGAVAIEAAAADAGVKAVLSDCAFDSLHDAIAPRAAARKYPMAAGVAYSVVKTVTVRARARVDQADPIKFVDRLAPRPLFLIHGQKDDDTTPINGEKLFEKAKEPKQLWRTAEADHAESIDKYPDEYRRRTLAFFDAAL